MEIKKKFLFYILIVFVLVNFSAYGNEIKTIAIVNNTTITTYDLFKKVEAIKILTKKKITISHQNYILDQLIENEIKKIEIDKNKINIANNIIKKISDEKILSYKLENPPNFLKQYIFYETKLENEWNKLINIKFSNKLSLNTNEIESVIKSKNLSDSEVENLILIQKNRKLNSISKSYFNSIKRNAFVKKLLWNQFVFFWQILMVLMKK